MIQVQVRITADRKMPIELAIDILEREDANGNERKIAQAIEALVLKMSGHVAGKTGAAVETKVMTKDSPVWVDVVQAASDTDAGDGD